MPIHAKKEKPFEVDMSVYEATKPIKYVPKKQTKKFVPPDPRCEQCYYWKNAAEASNYWRCCHFALENGKLRSRISETECGSFLERETAPSRKSSFTEVPMTQWSCPEIVDWKTQR